MISAKQLALNIPRLFYKDHNPAEVARVLVEKAKSDSAFHQTLLLSMKYLEKHAQEKGMGKSASIELASEVSKSAVESLTKVFHVAKETNKIHNESLVGGFRVRKGDMLVDGSVASRFKQLRASLKRTV